MLLTLQAAVCWLPLVERRGEVRLDAHMEAPGNPHLPSHDDGSCAICAVRALWGSVPQESAALSLVATVGSQDVAIALAAPTVGVTRANQSRAPPVVG